MQKPQGEQIVIFSPYGPKTYPWQSSSGANATSAGKDWQTNGPRWADNDLPRTIKWVETMFGDNCVTSMRYKSGSSRIVVQLNKFITPELEKFLGEHVWRDFLKDPMRWERGPEARSSVFRFNRFKVDLNGFEYSSYYPNTQNRERVTLFLKDFEHPSARWLSETPDVNWAKPLKPRADTPPLPRAAASSSTALELGSDTKFGGRSASSLTPMDNEWGRDDPASGWETTHRSREPGRTDTLQPIRLEGGLAPVSVPSTGNTPMSLAKWHRERGSGAEKRPASADNDGKVDERASQRRRTSVDDDGGRGDGFSGLRSSAGKASEMGVKDNRQSMNLSTSRASLTPTPHPLPSQGQSTPSTSRPNGGISTTYLVLYEPIGLDPLHKDLSETKVWLEHLFGKGSVKSFWARRGDDRLISGIETLVEVVDANLGKHSWKAWVENCPRANYNKGFGVFKATAKYQSDEGLKRANFHRLPSSVYAYPISKYRYAASETVRPEWCSPPDRGMKFGVEESIAEFIVKHEMLDD